MTSSVMIVGASGRMGRFAADWIATRTKDLLVGPGVARGEDLAARIARDRPAVGLDLTVAGLGAAHAEAFLRAGVPVVIGTSGVDAAEDARIDALAREHGAAGLVVPNFCLGVWLQQEMARLAARHFGSFEIVEEHHARKKDAPSGTAADTARQLAEVTGRDPSEVPIHSIRIEGLHSNQEVLFGGPGEVLRITHQNFGLEAFGPGIVAALRFVLSAPPGVSRGIGKALES